MKTLLNCDDVFETLTAGPFPAGTAADQQVQRHLESCAACRVLAEALKPACDLLHEVLPPSEQVGLPVYRDDEELATEAIMRRVRAAEPVSRRATNHSGWVKSVLVWNSLAATILLLFLFPWMLDGRDQDLVAHVPQSLVGMSLPPDCLQVARFGDGKIAHPPVSATTACEECHDSADVVFHGEHVSRLEYYCCTECHVASKKQSKVADVSRLVAACEVCHR